MIADEIHKKLQNIIRGELQEGQTEFLHSNQEPPLQKLWHRSNC